MSVNKRTGSPYWYIQFQYNGQNYIKSSKTNDKKLALKQEVQWRSQLIEEQQLGVKQVLSINEAFQLYSNSKSELISASHFIFWSKRACAYWSDKKHIHEITTLEIERYRSSLSSASYSNQTIKHAMNNVAGAIKYAKRMGYKVSEVQMPTIRLSKGRLTYLTIEDEQRLLAELEPTRSVKGLAPYDQRLPELQREMQDIYDFVIVLLDTGARHTEISSMRWDAINLDDGTIKLWRPKVQNQSVLFMSHRVHAVLTRRKQAASGPFIFTNSKGDARQYLAAPFRKAFDRAGLPNCSAHTLRHTHATRLIQNGLNLYEVKEILGHADIKTTMRYAHLEQAKVSQKAVDVINQLQQSQK
jgi:integrase